MKISRFELNDRQIVELASGDSIEVLPVLKPDIKNGRKKQIVTEELQLRFSSGIDLVLPKARNYRRTEVSDFVVVESDFTQRVLFCGGSVAYVLLKGSVLTEVETGYLAKTPEYLCEDFGPFQVFGVGLNTVIVWDDGVVIFDTKFNLLERRRKYADDILKSSSSTEIVLESQSTDEVTIISIPDHHR